MSYEYKYQSRLEDIVDDNVTEVDEQIFILDEIGYVYAQAAKADEYEAKAKAWDKYKTHMESHIAGEINEEEFVSDLKSDYFESGELNAKK